MENSSKKVRPHVQLNESDLVEYKKICEREGKTVSRAVEEHVLERIGAKQIPALPQFNRFWCGEYQGWPNCCYNHWLGLPLKDNIRHPLYPYEEKLYEDLKANKLLAIVKATGLGITEFLLRYAEYKCLTEFERAHVVIITGPNIEQAKIQIKRIQEHLRDKIDFESTDYEIRLPKGNIIKAFPSMNIDAARSLENPKLILEDEAAFFGMVNDEEARAVAERYQAKSDAQVIIYSTPGLPDGMFYNLMNEKTSPYKRIELHYQEGLIPHETKPDLTIYDARKLEKAKQSPSFNREYGLAWGYGWGDVYNMDEIEKCIKSYPLETVEGGFVEMDLDPGYGSSKFGIIIWQKLNGKMQILHTQELVRPNQSDALRLIRSLIQQYRVNRLRIDANNPELIAEFSNEINTVPQNFRETGLEMLLLSSNMVRDQMVEIHPNFVELVRQMRAAKRDSKNGDLDKKIMSYDLVDPFRMGCWGFAKGSDYSVITRGLFSPMIERSENGEKVRIRIIMSPRHDNKYAEINAHMVDE